MGPGLWSLESRALSFTILLREVARQRSEEHMPNHTEAGMRTACSHITKKFSTGCGTRRGGNEVHWFNAQALER